MTLIITPDEIVQNAESTGNAGLLAKDPRWGRVYLGEVATIQNGAPFSSRLFNTVGHGIPLIRIRDLTAGESTTYFSGEFDDSYLVRRGDLLVGMDGDFKATIWTGGEGLLNQRVCRIQVAAPEVYDSAFLSYVLQGYLDAIWGETSAVTVKHLSSKTLARIPLPLPPLDEQQRIVAILEEHLSRLDAAARALSRTLLLARSLRESILAAALSWKVAREGKDWRSATLADVATWSSGGTPSTSNKAFYGGEIPWVVIGDLTESWVDATEKTITEAGYEASAVKRLPRGTIMLAMYGASIGRTGRMATEMTTNQAIACAVVDESVLDPEFLLLFLQSQRRLFVAAGRGGAQPNISQRIVKAWPIRFPELAEQRRIVETVNGALAAADRLQAEVLRTDVRVAALRRSLLASAFSGQLTREPISV